MSSAPQAAEPSTTRFDPRRLFADNPVVVLTLVFIGVQSFLMARRTKRASSRRRAAQPLSTGDPPLPEQAT